MQRIHWLRAYIEAFRRWPEAAVFGGQITPRYQGPVARWLAESEALLRNFGVNHALIMPSRYEGLPLAIVEAMLCGRPVVATAVAGNSEVIEDRVTGFLADAPTVASMAQALDRFWTRRDDARKIGAAVAERIRQLAPPDPVRIFSDKLKEIVATTKAV